MPIDYLSILFANVSNATKFQSHSKIEYYYASINAKWVFCITNAFVFRYMYFSLILLFYFVSHSLVNDFIYQLNIEHFGWGICFLNWRPNGPGSCSTWFSNYNKMLSIEIDLEYETYSKFNIQNAIGFSIGKTFNLFDVRCAVQYYVWYLIVIVMWYLRIHPIGTYQFQNEYHNIVGIWKCLHPKKKKHKHKSGNLPWTKHSQWVLTSAS